MNEPNQPSAVTQISFDFVEESWPYKTTEVSLATGLSVRQLDYWAREGYFMPSWACANGQGSRRLYSFSDILQLRFIQELMENDWTRRESFEALGACRAILSNPSLIEDAIFIREGTQMLAICKTGTGKRVLLDAARAGGQQVMEIVLEVLHEQTLNRLAEIRLAEIK